jgi:hypothetical protein
MEGQRSVPFFRPRDPEVPIQGVLVPHVALVEFDAVFAEEVPVFVLEGLGAVVLLLIVDVGDQLVQVPWTDGECAIAALPCELGEGGGLVLQPSGGGCLQLIHEIGDGAGPREPERKVHMIGHAADTVAFAIGMAGNGGEVGVEVSANLRGEEGSAILRAEDEMNDRQAEGLWHGRGPEGGADGAGLQPLLMAGPIDLGLAA